MVAGEGSGRGYQRKPEDPGADGAAWTWAESAVPGPASWL